MIGLPNWLNIFRKKTSGGGGGVSWALIAHTAVNGSTGDTTCSAIDTTGANLLVVPHMYDGGTPPPIIDSKGNTWVLSSNFFSFNPRIRFYYCLSPSSVGSAHTVTLPVESGTSPSFYFWAFAKTGGSPSLDAEATGVLDSAGWHARKILTGSVTPATATDLFIAAVGSDAFTSSTVASADSGYTMLDGTMNTGVFLVAAAYKIKAADSAAENPGWTESVDNNADVVTAGICFQ